MVIRCRRAVLWEGSELGKGPNPEYPPRVMRILVIWWRRGGGGMLLNRQLDGGKTFDIVHVSSSVVGWSSRLLDQEALVHVIEFITRSIRW